MDPGLQFALKWVTLMVKFSRLFTPMSEEDCGSDSGSASEELELDDKPEQGRASPTLKTFAGYKFTGFIGKGGFGLCFAHQLSLLWFFTYTKLIASVYMTNS